VGIAKKWPRDYDNKRVRRLETVTGNKMRAALSRGFTILELLIVVAIIGIATVASVPEIRNTLETRALEGAARDIHMALQTAKWKATADKINYRVRFSVSGTTTSYIIERELTAGTWSTAPGSVLKSIPNKLGVTLTLPSTKDVIFTPTGFVSNYDSTKNSIVVSSAKLASLSQPSNRTIRFYAGGSIQYLKS
jgi:prepilin-type N-terminal cleavage/methylation domain-containing protein